MNLKSLSNLQHEFPLKIFDVILVYFKNRIFQSGQLVIMTLVATNLTFIPAARATTDDTLETKKRKSLIQIDQMVKPTLPKAPLLEEDEDSAPYFYSHDESFSLRIGGALDFKELQKDNGDKDVPMVLGMRYMMKSENSKHQEYGVDLLTGDNSRLFINGGYKYIIDHTDSLRPYYKIGAGLRFDEGDGIETPTDFKSWSLVGSLGLEDLTSDPHSLRVDLDIHWGREDFLALVTFGWSLGF